VLIAFLLRFVLLLGVYLIPFRPLGDVYAAIAAGTGNLLVGGGPHSGAVLHFDRHVEKDSGDGEPPLLSPEAYGIELTARNVDTGRVVRVPIDTRTLAYVPTAVYVALSVAAPIWNGARGAIVLGAGILALQSFLLLSIVTPLALFFANPMPMHLVDLGPASRSVLDVLYRTLVAPPGMAFAFPGLLWLFMVWIVSARTPVVSAPAPA
jgi:hypothetical protein